VTALMVHHKLSMEKKIDRHVVKDFKIEMFLGIFSILFFIVSYVLTIK